MSPHPVILHVHSNPAMYAPGLWLMFTHYNGQSDAWRRQFLKIFTSDRLTDAQYAAILADDYTVTQEGETIILHLPQ